MPLPCRDFDKLILWQRRFLRRGVQATACSLRLDVARSVRADLRAGHAPGLSELRWALNTTRARKVATTIVLVLLGRVQSVVAAVESAVRRSELAW